jgi:hypothetical protein
MSESALSASTIGLCCELLAKVSISAAQPDFDEQVARVSVAKKELLAEAARLQSGAEIAAQSTPTPNREQRSGNPASPSVARTAVVRALASSSD